jgi:hypothetical protein
VQITQIGAAGGLAAQRRPGALQDVGGEQGVGIGVRPGLAGCPVAVEVDPDRLAVMSQLPGDLGHVQSVPGHGGADQAEQASDHAAAAGVQVRRQSDEGAVAVAVRPEAVFQGGDERLPLLAGRRIRVRRESGKAARASPAATGSYTVTSAPRRSGRKSTRSTRSRMKTGFARREPGHEQGKEG